MAIHRWFVRGPMVYVLLFVTVPLVWVVSTGTRNQQLTGDEGIVDPHTVVFSRNLSQLVATHGTQHPLMSEPRGLNPDQSKHHIPGGKPFKGIILNAKYRAGSTFSSEFFNQNKDMFFLYEPLYILNTVKRLFDSADTLRNTLNCNISQLMKTTTSLDQKKWIQYQLICILRQMPDCVKGYTNSIPEAERLCREAKYRVTKTIRVDQLETLETLIREGYKVVHVLRDPRGTMNSRKHIQENKGLRDDKMRDIMYSEAREYCSDAVMDLAYASEKFKNGDKHFIDSYLFMRYEDLAMKPLESLERIYNFLGIAPDKHVREWAETQERLVHQNKTEETQKAAMSEKVPYNPYQTTRSNPAAVTEKWRFKNGLDFGSVAVIQLACSSFLEIAGYLPLPDRTSMADTQTYPSLTNFNREALFGSR